MIKWKKIRKGANCAIEEMSGGMTDGIRENRWKGEKRGEKKSSKRGVQIKTWKKKEEEQEEGNDQSYLRRLAIIAFPWKDARRRGDAGNTFSTTTASPEKSEPVQLFEHKNKYGVVVKWFHSRFT